jgi:hypothetical protein
MDRSSVHRRGDTRDRVIGPTTRASYRFDAPTGDLDAHAHPHDCPRRADPSPDGADLAGGGPVLSGAVEIDLTDAKPERMRPRVAGLACVPAGARVILRVGALAPEPEAIPFVAPHEERLQLEVQGTASAVPQWLNMLRIHLGEVPL